METIPANTGKKVITLLSGDEGTVTIIPKSRDAFCMSVAEAIEACQSASTGFSYLNQVGDLGEVLGHWIQERTDRISAAYMSFRDAGILFIVVQTGVKRDNQLSDELTELDIKLASDERFSSLSIDVLSVPKSSADSILAFTSSGRVNQYAGNQ